MIRIDKHNQNFQELKWVISARSKTGIKPVMQNMFVDEQNFVCTDSMRLHIFESEANFKEAFNFENGLYEIVSEKRGEITFNKLPEDFGQFPNYKQVIPKETEEFTAVSKSYGNNSRAISTIYRDFFGKYPEINLCFNVNFLNDILNIGYPFSVNCAKPYGSFLMTPMVFKAENYLAAVIMPMQCKAD